MLIRELRDGETVELRLGEVLLGFIGCAAVRRHRAKLALQLLPSIQVSASAVAVRQLARCEQAAKAVSPVA